LCLDPSRAPTLLLQCNGKLRAAKHPKKKRVRGKVVIPEGGRRSMKWWVQRFFDRTAGTPQSLVSVRRRFDTWLPVHLVHSTGWFTKGIEWLSHSVWEWPQVTRPHPISHWGMKKGPSVGVTQELSYYFFYQSVPNNYMRLGVSIQLEKRSSTNVVLVSSPSLPTSTLDRPFMPSPVVTSLSSMAWSNRDWF